MMKIGIIHYHLKSGGVTTVIRHQAEAVGKECDLLMLTGEAPPFSDFPADCAVIPGLGYDNIARDSTPEETAEKIMAAMHAKWGMPCDVLHVHNPLLAKNRRFLSILDILGKKGISLFLQIHDFAEDGRPNAYYHQEYPEDCHYGVINSRDCGILLNSGLDKSGVHKIVNMVAPLDIDQKTSAQENIILYPIRAIRRKNIGEAILLSLFFKNRETLAITLPPNSPVDMACYGDWKTYVKTHRLNIAFEVSGKRDFRDLVHVSKYIVTTSITEGFGFSFLEPWTGRKMLWGRKLPDICMDFERNNVNLGGMYTAIDIPLDWIDEKLLFETWRSAWLTACTKFDIPMNTETVQDRFNQYIHDRYIDFGLLDETFQRQVISNVLASKKAAEHLVRTNPFLSDIDVPVDKGRINQNRTAVLKAYNREAYKKNLISIYQKVKGKPVHHKIDKKKLVNAFLDPSGFSLLKWSGYGKQ